MYKRILVPTDGSRLAEAAAHAAVELARSTGATVVAFHALPSYETSAYETVALSPGWIPEEKFEKLARRTAKKALAAVERIAAEAEVPFESCMLTAQHPALAIVQAASDKTCDLIFMGSHGHGNLAQLFLGGVTTKVLSICNLPVLVHRTATGKSAKRRTRRKS